MPVQGGKPVGALNSGSSRPRPLEPAPEPEALVSAQGISLVQDNLSETNTSWPANHEGTEPWRSPPEGFPAMWTCNQYPKKASIATPNLESSGHIGRERK